MRLQHEIRELGEEVNKTKVLVFSEVSSVIGTGKQCRIRSDCFLRRSLIGLFQLCLLPILSTPIWSIPIWSTPTSSTVFSSPEPKAHKVSLWYTSRAGVRLCVSELTLSNMNISATSGPIITRFYLKHHWGGGKAALCFRLDRIGTLVSMATDSSHRVIMGKT